MDRIVVATDLSDRSRLGLEAGIRIATDLGAGVVLVHALQGLPAGVGIAGGRVQRDLAAQQEQVQVGEAQELTESWAEEVRAAGLDVEVVAEEADPTDLILRAVEEHGAEMVVMASHGRGAVLNLLAGSVTQSVLHKATVPVLVVPARD